MTAAKHALPTRFARLAMAVGATLGLLGTSSIASASMIATFGWVDVSHSAGVVPFGSLTLTLPNSITTQTFDTGALSQSAASSMLTGFSYTFSDGLSVALADITTFAFTAPIKWATSSATHGGFGSPGIDLITGFTFSGSKVFSGDARAAVFKIAEPAGLPGNVGLASNQVTPFVGAASNDAGYWKLTSLEPVPLPAALPLLVSGLALLGGVRRRCSLRPFGAK